MPHNNDRLSGIQRILFLSLNYQLSYASNGYSRTKSPTVLEDFDYAFAENGLTAYKLGQPLASQSFIKFLGEERHKTLVNFILHYIADLDIPIKRCVVLCSWCIQDMMR